MMFTGRQLTTRHGAWLGSSAPPKKMHRVPAAVKGIALTPRDAQAVPPSATALSAEDFALDCANEAIHVPEAVQPHGACVAVDVATGQIRCASSNLLSMVGLSAEQALGRSITEVSGWTQAQWSGVLNRATDHRAVWLGAPLAWAAAGGLEVLAHRGDDGALVLDLLPSSGEPPVDDGRCLLDDMTQALDLLGESDSVAQFLQTCVGLVQQVTQYDRVLVYRFEPDWTGRVMAEATADGVEPRFVGLHFPASDIPAQARALYTRNLLRVVGDTEAQPVALLRLPETAPLDQSHSLLRTVSPMHLAYMRNMGVRASLTISLMHQGRLWGLVSCHHRTPKLPPQHLRQSVLMACAWVGKVAAMRLDTLLQMQVAAHESHLIGRLAELEANASNDTIDPRASQQEVLSQACRLFASDGVEWFNGEDWLHLPTATPLDALTRIRLMQRAGLGPDGSVVAQAPDEPLAVEHREGLGPLTDAAGLSWAGLLAVRLPTQTPGLLVLWRSERKHQVFWAGKPQKAMASGAPSAQASATAALGPRNSFEAWLQEVRDRCAPWAEAERRQISALAQLLARLAQRTEWRAAQAQLRLLGSSMDHLTDMVLVTEAEPLDLPGPRIVFANRALLEHSGYTMDELLGLTPRVFQSPQTDPGELARVREAMKQWQPVKATLLNQTRDGKPYWVELTINPVTDERGWVIQWVSVQRDVSSERQLAEERRRTEERLRLVLQGANDAAWDWNLEQQEVYYSPRWWLMMGREPSEAAADPALWLRWMHPDDLDAAQQTMRQALEHGPDQFQMEFRLQHQGGHHLRLLSRGFIQRDANGRAVRVSGTNTDITERAAQQEALRASEEKFRLVAENTSDGIVIYDLEKVRYASPAFARLTGHTEAFENSQSLAAVMQRIHPEDLPMVDRQVRDAIAEHAHQLVYEFRFLHAKGHYFYREDSVRLVYTPRGGLKSAYVIVRDVTERREAQRQIERLAFFDPLTELCNRRLLTDRLSQALPASERSQRFGALMFIDLDNFKDLNDTHGHALGDDLLRQAATRLLGLVREGDTVARLGGDEFVLLLMGMGSDADGAALQAGVLGRKVLKALAAPFHLGMVSHQCTGSVGITLFRGQSQTVDDILKRADVAMYQAKSAGRNCLRFFDPGVQAVVEARSQLEQDLRRSVEREELALFYQPIVNGRTEVMGYEALVRWRHPQRGLVPPSEFIALAESTGLIQPIGRWVLQQACRQLAHWARSSDTAHLTLSVNLSARQLLLPSFVIQVLEVLQHEHAPGKRLKLEITESLLQDDVEQTILKMQALARHGIRFSLDDFGTGYSSLSYLKRLPLSQLKIDRSFVRDLLTDSNDEAIARMILQLAQTLDMDVVAEGVEEAAQLAALRDMGCQQFQGYLFGKPAPLPAALSAPSVALKIDGDKD